MKILGIETSCDDTAVSLVEGRGKFARPRFRVLAHLVSSQAKTHEPWGGVVPSLAKREHARNLIPLLKRALGKAGVSGTADRSQKTDDRLGRKLGKILEREPELLAQLSDFLAKHGRPEINVIAVTKGPGLEPALWVGVNLARALARAWQKPLIPINHMEGHIYSVLVSQKGDTLGVKGVALAFPALALLISGGHTELVLIKDWLKYQVIGRTRDDAAGEAFDKVARILGLPYPGGPEISRLAAQTSKTGNVRHSMSNIKLPRPMINSGDLDFSFSGLKTAVLYLVQRSNLKGTQGSTLRVQIAREFQQAVIDVLLAKTAAAIRKHRPRTLIVGGGVAANQELKKQFSEKLSDDFPNIQFLTPNLQLSTDNATMIAIAGYFHALKKEFRTRIKADGNLSLNSD